MARIDRFYADPVVVCGVPARLSGYVDPQLSGLRSPAVGEFLYDGLRGDDATIMTPPVVMPGVRDLVLFAAGFAVGRWLFGK